MKIKTANHGVFEGKEQWTAIDEDKGPENPVGIGETEEAAIQDLREQISPLASQSQHGMLSEWK